MGSNPCGRTNIKEIVLTTIYLLEQKKEKTMLMSIIQHGTWRQSKYNKRFECANCGCVFETDQYKYRTVNC